MSIEITGQQKYLFQDLVCVYILLEQQEFSLSTFLVEPEGGEDAEIHFQNGHKIEIQVKGADQPVTLKSIAEMLSHYPDKSSENCLLERIYNGDKKALFIMSGRCDDKTVSFVKPHTTNLNEFPPTETLKKNQEELKEHLLALNWKNTTLFQSRKQHFEEVVQNIEAFKPIVESIYIWENFKEGDLEQLINNKLQSTFYVSPDKTYSAVKRLIDVVVKGKRNGCIIDSFKKELAHLSGNSLYPENYVHRSDEHLLLKELKAKNVLLLSGVPRSGKTTTAKYIASQLQDMGIDSKMVASIDDAERLLMGPSSHAKLIILDDPFEHLENISQEWHRLCLLLEKTNSNRKLIVSQPQEKVLEYKASASLNDCSIKGCTWYNITEAKADFLKSLWLQLCEQYSIDEKVKNIITLYLHDHLIEPGCLTHLASNIKSFSGKYNKGELIRFARQDASKFYGILKRKDLDALAFIISISTSNLTGITELDLAFLLSDDEDLPSYYENDYIISLGDEEEFKPPKYSKEYNIDSIYEDKIDTLEEMNVILTSSDGKFNFSHSFYRSAAEQYISGIRRRKAKKVLNWIKKGLFCANPRVACSIASNLDWIIRQFNKFDFSEDVLKLTYEGLSSRYPAVQDICFSNLVENFNYLPKELGKLQKLVGKVTYGDYSELYWHDEHATWGPYQFLQGPAKVAGIESFACNFSEQKDLYYPPEIIFSIIDFFILRPELYNLNSLFKFMTYPEAIIRSNAISVWIKANSICHESANIIFSNKHPRTSVEILRSAFSIWPDLNEEKKSLITSGLAEVASTPDSAISMLSFLEKTYRYSFSDASPWELFSKVLPSVLEYLPTEARLEGSRMYTSIRESIGKADPNDSINICKTWLKQLKRRLLEGALPSDYALGVADMIIQATIQEPQLRKGLIQDIFNSESLSLQLVSFKDLILSWEVLTTNEKNFLLTFIAESKNKDWFTSTLITFKVIPPEFYNSIETVKYFVEHSVKEIKNNLPIDILQKSVQIHCGAPQPLWWIGLHHHDSEKMNSLIWEIASDLDHPLCEICWSEITLSASRDDKIANLISIKSEEHAERILDLLLKKKLNCVGDFMPLSWGSLFDLVKDKELIIDKLDEFLPIILDDISDLSFWINDKELWPLFIKKLEIDYRYIKLLKVVNDIKDEDTIQLFERLIYDALPRLKGTCDRLINYFKKHDPDKSAFLLDLLNSHRSNTIYLQAQDMEFSIPSLEGWSKP